MEKVGADQTLLNIFYNYARTRSVGEIASYLDILFTAGKVTEGRHRGKRSPSLEPFIPTSDALFTILTPHATIIVVEELPR